MIRIKIFKTISALAFVAFLAVPSHLNAMGDNAAQLEATHENAVNVARGLLFVHALNALLKERLSIGGSLSIHLPALDSTVEKTLIALKRIKTPNVKNNGTEWGVVQNKLAATLTQELLKLKPLLVKLSKKVEPLPITQRLFQFELPEFTESSVAASEERMNEAFQEAKFEVELLTNRLDREGYATSRNVILKSASGAF